MNDGQMVEIQTRPAYWTPELGELDRSLDAPARGVSTLEQQVVGVAEAAAAAGAWAPVFEAWAVLARRHQDVTSGEAMTVWASARRKAVDLDRCQPALDFRVFEADLVLGVWPELRWGEGESPPGHAPGDCEAAWLGLWRTLWQAAGADLSRVDTDAAKARLDEDQLAPLVAFSRLAATVFAPRRGDEALGMPARWRLGLLKQVRAFEAAAVGAPGGEALARPDHGDAEAGTIIAAGCCALFHHAGRGLGGGAGRGRAFGAALDDLIAEPLPAAEAAWPDGARRSLERLFRFWAVGDAALRALLEGALDLDWSDTRTALPAPEAPAPQDVVERIALVGGSYVGKTSFLFGSEHLRKNAGDTGGEDDRLPVIEHAWLENTAATNNIDEQRERWREGEPSQTARPELVAATGVHSFQAFEIVDMKGEDLLAQDNAVMDYAMRDLFTFRPPSALALMLDTVAPLSGRDLVSVERLVTRALEAHAPRSGQTAAGPVPPVHLIANKTDRFIASLRAALSGAAAEPQEEDAALLDALCDGALDLGLLMRRAAHEGANRDGPVLPLLMREALEAEALSASPTLGVAVDRLLEREGALMAALISKGVTNVVLNFTCSAPPGVVPGIALKGILAFWNEIWGWAGERRGQALAVQRRAFVKRPEEDRDEVKSILTRSALHLEHETILDAYNRVVAQAGESAKTLATRLENGPLPTTAEGFAAWLGESGKGGLVGLWDAVESVGKAAHNAESRLKTGVDTIIGHLISLLGIDPEAKFETMLDRQRHGDIVNMERDWLDEMQVMVAGQDDARIPPALIASDKPPEPLVRARELLKNINADQEDPGFRLLRQMVEQQEAAIRPAASFKKMLPGGPDGNPRLFHRIHGALLDDCFLKNEPWRREHLNNNSVALLLGEPLLGMKALLIDRAGTPALEERDTLWRDTLAPLLRLLVDYRPKFPQLAMQRYESDAVKVKVLAKMATRRRAEELIVALEASLDARAALAETPGIAARVRQLTMIEAMLPALRQLGFDAPAFENLVRRGTPDERHDAIAAEEGAPGLMMAQGSVREQRGLWPGIWIRMIQKKASVIQPICAELAVLRNDLSGRFGNRILPEPNQEDAKSLERAVTCLQVGVLLLQVAAGGERHERAELAAELRNLGGRIANMRAAVEAVEETIRTDILLERYRRFLALDLEEREEAVNRLHDGFRVTDGGIVRADDSLDEVEQRYLTAMRRYFDERGAAS